MYLGTSTCTLTMYLRTSTCTLTMYLGTSTGALTMYLGTSTGALTMYLGTSTGTLTMYLGNVLRYKYRCFDNVLTYKYRVYIVLFKAILQNQRAPSGRDLRLCGKVIQSTTLNIIKFVYETNNTFVTYKFEKHLWTLKLL